MSLILEGLLTAMTPIAHGDPGATDSIQNTVTFRRLPTLVQPDYVEPVLMPDMGEEETLQVLRALVATEPLPVESDPILAGALRQLPLMQFLACALLKELIQQLNVAAADGRAGLYEGKERYTQLARRLNIVGESYHLRITTFVSRLLAALRVQDLIGDRWLKHFAALPLWIQQQVIEVLREERHAVLSLARSWAAQSRLGRGQDERAQSEEDVQKSLLWAEKEQDQSASWYPLADLGQVREARRRGQVVMIPHVSTNALRHSIFRQTLCQHLFLSCGFPSFRTVNDDRLVPEWVAMLFSNGGNVVANMREPENSQQITTAVMRLFPSLELVSGCLPTHAMGEGALHLANWTVCRELQPVLSRSGITATVFASELLQEVVHTRQVPEGLPHQKEYGQMLFAHVVMIPGSQVLLQVRLSPFCSTLARGAMWFALQQWLKAGGLAGARGAVGEGACFQWQSLLIRDILRPQIPASELWAELDAAAEDYVRYIEQHADLLREELVSGRLGWKTPLGQAEKTGYQVRR
ncbi:MAG: hypothetical protein IRZ03_12725 [Acidobacterium ailaaui]|jgi:hypothetical protein|nr:hypothetical protein [Pseudacidobacterium ailaaui]